jgi:hypothetical protein
MSSPPVKLIIDEHNILNFEVSDLYEKAFETISEAISHDLKQDRERLYKLCKVRLRFNGKKLALNIEPFNQDELENPLPPFTIGSTIEFYEMLNQKFVDTLQETIKNIVESEILNIYADAIFTDADIELLFIVELYYNRRKIAEPAFHYDLQGKSLMLYLSYEQSDNIKLAPTFNLNCEDRVSMRPIIMEPPYNTIYGLNIEHSTPSVGISNKTTPRYLTSTVKPVDMEEILNLEKRNFIRIVCVALKDNRIIDADFANYTKQLLCESNYRNITPDELNLELSRLSDDKIYIYRDEVLLKPLIGGYNKKSKRKMNKKSKRKIRSE